jgi:menaquinone-specific isochorismate synthase
VIRSVRTERIDDQRPLLTILGELDPLPSEASADTRTVFVHDGEGMVTTGSAAEITVPSTPGSLRIARASFTALATGVSIEDRVRLPGTGLIAIGSFAFDPAASTTPSVLRIPRTVIGRRDGITWRTVIDTTDDPTGAVAGDPTAGMSTGPDATFTAGPDAGGPDRPRYAGSTLDDAEWLDVVARGMEEIRTGRAEKVVLARDVHLWSRAPFDRRACCMRSRSASRRASRSSSTGCSARHRSCCCGARRDVASRVLAGTAPRGRTTRPDAQLGAASARFGQGPPGA